MAQAALLLKVVRDEEERRLRDAMRDVPTPWLKAGINALGQVEVEAGQRAAVGIVEAQEPLREIAASAAARTRTQLLADLQEGGLQLKGRSPDGRFAEFVDGSGTVRAKIHPPDAATPYAHLHLYDSEGNALDSALRPVSPKSSDAHLRIREP